MVSVWRRCIPVTLGWEIYLAQGYTNIGEAGGGAQGGEEGRWGWGSTSSARTVSRLTSSGSAAPVLASACLGWMVTRRPVAGPERSGHQRCRLLLWPSFASASAVCCFGWVSVREWERRSIEKGAGGRGQHLRQRWGQESLAPAPPA